MPTVGTLACLVAVAAFVRVASQTPPERETQPVDCSDPDGPAIYLVPRSKKTKWVFHSWDMAAGDRGVLWSYETASLGFEKITSCGIGSKDSKVYCIVRQTEGDFVARMDSKGFVYVARMPGGWAVGGTCDENGALLATTNEAGIWRLSDIDTLAGFSKPWDGMPKMEELGVTSATHGYDVVVWEGWLVSANGRGVVIVTDLADSGLTTRTLSRSGGDELPNQGCGAAFLSGGDVYVAGNGAGGLFRLELQLESGSYTATRVGGSEDAGTIDGLYCVNAADAGPQPEPDGGIKDAVVRAAFPPVAALVAVTLTAWATT